MTEENKTVVRVNWVPPPLGQKEHNLDTESPVRTHCHQLPLHDACRTVGSVIVCASLLHLLRQARQRKCIAVEAVISEHAWVQSEEAKAAPARTQQ